MKQNLLITGGLGYIGSFTCKSLLLKNKKKPFVVDNLSRGNFFAKKYSNSLIANLSNKKVIKFISDKKIDTVLHLASLTCVRESVKKKKKYLSDYDMQIKFIKSLKNTSVKNFIFSSSLSIFEKKKYKKNLSVYSKNKLNIERYLKKISSKNFKVVILRYPNVIGSDPLGKLGEKNNYISRIVPIFYRKILNKKLITLYYNFKMKKFPKRNYIHVNDIAKINLQILENLKDLKKSYVVFDIFNNKQYSNFEVMMMLSKILNKKPLYKLEKLDDRESMDQKSDIKNNFLKKLNYKLKYNSLRKILETNKKWFKKIY